MVFLQSLITCDFASVFIMILLANLSRQLGEALKIAPYYRILYVTAALVLMAAGLDLFRETFFIIIDISAVTLAARCLAALLALVTCLPYWKWLFSEYFFKQR